MLYGLTSRPPGPGREISFEPICYSQDALPPALVVFAHGSRIESANVAVRDVAADLAQAGNFPLVEAAFLELGRPSLEEAVDRLYEQGVRRVLVVPYFLTPGRHLELDLPRLISDISHKYKDLYVSSVASLDGHPGLVQILLDRVMSAEPKNLTTEH
jgi:sirohydrochlorin ferrochelatase